MTPSDAERDRQRQISDLAKEIASSSFLMEAIARWTEQVVTAAVEAEREKQRQRISDLIRDGLGEIGKREAVEARLREAREVIQEARDAMSYWGDCSSPYLQDKHDLPGDLAKLDAWLNKEKTDASE